MTEVFIELVQRERVLRNIFREPKQGYFLVFHAIRTELGEMDLAISRLSFGLEFLIIE